MQTIVFIYSKDNVIKVLDFEKGKLEHDNLINQGWNHTQTLNACTYLEYLHNSCNNIVESIKELSIKN